jgi:hypothetical protein
VLLVFWQTKPLVAQANTVDITTTTRTGWIHRVHHFPHTHQHILPLLLLPVIIFEKIKLKLVLLLLDFLLDFCWISAFLTTFWQCGMAMKRTIRRIPLVV